MAPTLACLCLMAFLLINTDGEEIERILYKRLLSERSYNKLIRPQSSTLGGPTVVYLGLRLSQFISLDEQKEQMLTQVWLEEEWWDHRLVWEPSNFSDTRSIHVPAEDLWRPDIVLLNNIDGKYEVAMSTRAEIFFNGTVRWMAPALCLSTCRIDMEYFPYDEQTCSMRFGSWTYDGGRVELRHHLQRFAPELQRPLKIDYAADLQEFRSIIEYDILSVSATCSDHKYKHSAHTYPHIIFHFHLRRRSAFHTFNLLLPCVGIAILAILTFLLPPDCREKISLSITTLVALTLFFLLLVSETAPATSLSVPLIAKYLLFTIMLITSSILLTVVVLNMHFRAAETLQRPGRWTRRVFMEILPPLLGFSPPQQLRMPQALSINKTHQEKEVEGNSLTLAAQRKTQCRTLQKGGQEEPPTSLAQQLTYQLAEQCSDEVPFRFWNKLRHAAWGAQAIQLRFSMTKQQNDVKEEWQFVALVLDRISLLIFSVATVICTLTIFLGSPVLWNYIEPLTPSSLPFVTNLTSFNDSEMLQPNRTISILLLSH